MIIRKPAPDRRFRAFVGDGTEPASIIRVPAPPAAQTNAPNQPLQKPAPVPPLRRGVEPAKVIPVPRPNPATPKQGGDQGDRTK